MTILAVQGATQADSTVLKAAAKEALLHKADLLVVSVDDRSGRTTAEGLRAQLGELGDRLDAAGLGVSIGHSPLADPADAVVQIAQQENARLIVLGIRRRSPVGKLILGSLTQRILLDSTCPVLAVPA